MKKVCRKCGIEKLISEFTKSKAYPDGHKARCKSCLAEEYRNWVSKNPQKKLDARTKYRINNREHIREMDKNYYEIDPERYREKARRAAEKYNKKEETKELKRQMRIKMRELYPEKDRARELVRNAVRRGELVKPDNCSCCGEKAVCQGHHEDYKKPLEVSWMCKKCHWKLHTDIGPERLNPMTSKEDVIVRTTEETCGGEVEVPPPPSKGGQ